MRLRFAAAYAAIAAALGVACGGRPNPSASLLGNLNDAAAAHDATSTPTRPSFMHDAAAVPDAGDIGTCAIPAVAQSVATCHVAQNLDKAAWCHRPTQYALYCSEELDASLGCDLAYIEDAPTRGFAYCCPCEGTDAATGCANVDPSTYDRSCTRDSDCMFIWGGMSCPGGCTYVCGGGNAAVNVDSQARYQQTLALVKAASLDTVCHCPNWAGYGPVCLHGACTLPQ